MKEIFVSAAKPATNFLTTFFPNFTVKNIIPKKNLKEISFYYFEAVWTQNCTIKKEYKPLVCKSGHNESYQLPLFIILVVNSQYKNLQYSQELSS